MTAARELYAADPRTDRTHRAVTELGDECRHSVMFGNAIARCGVPAYGPARRVRRLGWVFKSIAHGPGAYASVLVAEDLLHRWQRELMNTSASSRSPGWSPACTSSRRRGGRLANPHYRRTLAWTGERVVAFLDEQGMIGAADRPLWPRSLLVPV